MTSMDNVTSIQLVNVLRKDDHGSSSTGSLPPAYEDVSASQGAVNIAYCVDTAAEDLDLNAMSKIDEGGRKAKENNVGACDHDDDDSDDDDDEEYSKLGLFIAKGRAAVAQSMKNHSRVIRTLFGLSVAAAYLVYFGWVMAHYFDTDDEGDIRLLWVTCAAFALVGSKFIPQKWWDVIMCRTFCSAGTGTPKRVRNILYWSLVVCTVLFIVTFVVVDVAIKRPGNLISALGMAVFLAIFYVGSHRPEKVKFRPVFWGLSLQFFFALLILRTNAGFSTFLWLGERVGEFLDHTDAGAKFVFGEDYVRHFFALKVLMVVVFFSAFISIMYYWGVMQFVIRNIARLLSVCLGTSPSESLNTAGNIFVSQSEAPLLIRPFLSDMTKSEIHAVCTGGFATIAGSNLAAYTAMGAPAIHLLSATVMNAPAALAMSKLFYPETQRSKANANEVYNMAKRPEHNVIEAACNGASVSIKLIANIAVNLVAFIALLELVNTALTWFGYRINMTDPPLTFQFICSYVFYPIAWLLGAASTDVRKVASLIATKTFINEYVAYGELGVYIANNEKYAKWLANHNETGGTNDTSLFYVHDDLHLGNDTVLKGGLMSDRSVVISTYALCGFSNISSIGIMIGALSAMAPHRKKHITQVVVRAMIAGTAASFMTACIAGLLYKGPM